MAKRPKREKGMDPIRNGSIMWYEASTISNWERGTHNDLRLTSIAKLIYLFDLHICEIPFDQLANAYEKEEQCIHAMEEGENNKHEIA